MDKAKAAVGNFISKSGHHDTTVHESVAPGVQKETINEHQREERQVARDREVHQDHYHTSVQPIKDQEVLPEQHHHNLKGVEHRTHDHRDTEATKHHLQTEAAQFQNTSVRAPTQHKTSTAVPEVAGEHVHHHVHETIQPVVHKETIEPHVVHTTVPVHETIHNKAQHHTGSVLPTVNMHEFKNQGGALTGREEKHDHFKGEPRNIEQTLGGTGAGGLSQHTVGHQSNVTGGGYSGHGTDVHNGVTGERVGDPSTDASRHVSGGAVPLSGHSGSHTGTHTGAQSSTHTKPSLLDKLNPKKDADGDGKAGFLS